METCRINKRQIIRSYRDWRKLVLFIHSDDYFSSFTVTAIKNNYQKVKAAQLS